MSVPLKKISTAKSDPLGGCKGKDFLTLADFTAEQIDAFIQEARLLKEEKKQGKLNESLKGKTLGMIFEKPSTRTRVSFEVGMFQLGGHALFLSSKELQLGRGETLFDTAKVLSRYVDGVMIRTFAHDKLEQFAEHADVPVINGLTDLHHPAQVLADLLTIYEHKGRLKGLKMCYVGDGWNNMTHSLLEGAALTGMDLAVAYPENYAPNPQIVQHVLQLAKQSGSQIQLTTDPREAIEQADVVVTDVWTSMGFEAEGEKRRQDFQAFQVNQHLCAGAKEDFIFLHCLPAHRGEEVTAEIIDGPHSVVFDEAENRLHAQKAILKTLLSE
jgi:ornithine carbamoyltransferase